VGALKKHDDGTPDDVMVVATAGQLRALVRAAVREELEGTKAEPAPEYLTTQQVAELLQTSARNVRYFVTRGQLPALRVGTEYRFRRSAVLDYMEQREKGIDA
jgi:excisionase family DNA binding protein